MNNQDYQKWALSKNLTPEQYEIFGTRMGESMDQLKVLHAAMGISGEAGELMDAIKKHVLYNKPLDTENVKEEIGDLLWYMALMLESVGSSFEEAMKMNHDKLEKRYPSGFSEKDAQARVDKLEVLCTKDLKFVTFEDTQIKLHKSLVKE